MQKCIFPFAGLTRRKQQIKGRFGVGKRDSVRFGEISELKGEIRRDLNEKNNKGDPAQKSKEKPRNSVQRNRCVTDAPAHTSWHRHCLALSSLLVGFLATRRAY